MRELFAGSESVKTSDQRTHRDRCDDADAGLLQKLFDGGIINDLGLHFFGDVADFFVEVVDGVEMFA